MTTISEDYVSFETAKLLKEKGFDQDPNICNTAYTTKGKLSNNAKSFAFYYELIKPRRYSIAPTLQMAMKYLREVHKKWITITFHWHKVNEEATLYYSFYIMLSEYENVVLEDKNPIKRKLFNSYEQAAEAAIKYCLENLI